MDYWNFFAQRLEDPNRTGVTSYDQYPSFDALTGDRVDLQTDIVPRMVEPILQALTVDYPTFGLQLLGHPLARRRIRYRGAKPILDRHANPTLGPRDRCKSRCRHGACQILETRRWQRPSASLLGLGRCGRVVRHRC